MRRMFTIFAVAMCCSISFADGPVLLVTPQGVYRSEVVNGVPGEWVPQQIDVIVQGYGPGATPTPIPQPPIPAPSDPVVQQVAAVSKTLKDAAEATSVAAIIDSLSSAGVKDANLKEALELAAGIADSALKSEGRIAAWVKNATKITTSAVKLKAGLSSAWGIQAQTLEVIQQAIASPDGAETAAALDLDAAKIILIIKTILDLLKSLGII
ncbi:MAG TPA: hypothetical protein PK992_02695 [Planctomycetaceae bacterium]|nr:hypothetical protein [Planctomycetaceae bacterium]